MTDDVVEEILFKRLKVVSRSFYLSLKFLPSKTRRSISLAYVLARIADTLTDTDAIPRDLRLNLLGRFKAAVSNESPLSFDEAELGFCASDDEALLREAPLWLSQAFLLEDGVWGLVKEVLLTLISAMEMDLELFDGEGLSTFSDEALLEDYTYRIAGCVGSFWTRIHALAYPRFFRNRDVEASAEKAVCYGRGLQLINIIRDTRDDLLRKRFYWPLVFAKRNSQRVEPLLRAFSDGDDAPELWPILSDMREEMFRLCESNLSTGRAFCNSLPFGLFRLRFCSKIPLDIGLETVELLKRRPIRVQFSTRLRISRPKTYLLLMRNALALMVPHPHGFRPH